jgi:type IV pilus assembly protein PilA
MTLPLSLRARKGFTLIELLLVIGIIAILASIVIVAINPTRQLGQARDAQRRSDVNTILNAVYQYSFDHNGNIPTSIPSGTGAEICKGTTSPSDCTTDGKVNLRMLTGAYVVNLPSDPQVPATGTGTRYFIYKDSNNRITVNAPDSEQAPAIGVTR